MLFQLLPHFLWLWSLYFAADPSLVREQLFDACINLGSIHRLLKELHEAEELYKKAMEIAASMQDFDKEVLAKIHLAMCLLDRGELKQAIETYFNPLMIHKSSLSKYTSALYLQNYGNACRSAADWGKAKEYLREALELAKQLRDAGLVSSCCGDLGNVFRSEGRYCSFSLLFQLWFVLLQGFLPLVLWFSYFHNLHQHSFFFLKESEGHSFVSGLRKPTLPYLF